MHSSKTIEFIIVNVPFGDSQDGNSPSVAEKGETDSPWERIALVIKKANMHIVRKRVI